MKFAEMEYKHPDKDEVLQAIAEIEARLNNAKDYDEFYKAFVDYEELSAHYATQENIASIRHTVDTRDEFYTQEDDYFNEINPLIGNAQNNIIRTIFASPFVEQLKKDVPETFFLTNEFALKVVSPEIIEDLQEENKYASDYQKLVASAQIDFDGQTYTLAGLEDKMNDKDREVRKRAHKAYWGWFADHEKEIGEIYDKLVKIRTRMAKKKGYENYIPFGYIRMLRLDYDKDDVEVYRRNVLKDVVPVCMDLYAKQAKRHGYEGNTLPAWDEKVEFESGNPRPKYHDEELVNRALNMYKELSPQTGEFFQAMVDDELMDLNAKPGKAAGGYCTSLSDYKRPFIFANSNGTSHDVETLTHEAGHAFQYWSSKDIFPVELAWPTMESAEIDSMSMEFFTWPWMKNIFEEDTDKYYFSHLSGSVKFLPYGVLVDHFQHEVYEHPDWTPDERMACWRRLEKQYLPQKDYDEIDFLERGGWWMRQLHIFLHPFYYIDYTLAQVAALQFWARMQKEDPTAFEDYKKLCAAGGTLPFRGLIQLANLKVPFEEGCLGETMGEVQKWFDAHDASNY
ncbi:M3 family oligoendopeptidase [Erysipelotrichaceae bacterium RD49]|nr:M3 family oligoendopeptidase [Erysipelotrichaceae bacterium RD49]